MEFYLYFIVIFESIVQFSLYSIIPLSRDNATGTHELVLCFFHFEMYVIHRFFTLQFNIPEILR